MGKDKRDIYIRPGKTAFKLATNIFVDIVAGLLIGFGTYNFTVALEFPMVGIGGIALKSPFVMQTMSDVLNMPIKVCNTDQACALGAAMFAATAAGVYAKVEDAIAAMNSGFAKEYTPNAKNAAAYEKLYKRYLEIGAFTEQHC